MRSIGFSTGALCFGDFQRALKLLENTEATAVELSALRDNELAPLMVILRELNLSQFNHISIHAPSKLKSLSENEVVEFLSPCIDYNIPIIIHPDVINDVSLWKSFGSLLYIENMDKRKSAGKTVAELETIFNQLPEANWCFDIAHARQIDPTMNEAYQMLNQFSSKLRQIHISQIDEEGKHHQLDLSSISEIQKISKLIDKSVPIIIESMISEGKIAQEIASVRSALLL